MENELKYTHIDQEMNSMNIVKINDIVPVTTQKKFGRKLLSNGKVQSMRISQQMVDFHYSQNCDLSEIQSLGGNGQKSGRPKSKTPNKTQSRRDSQINIEQIDSSRESLLPPLNGSKSTTQKENQNMKFPDMLSNRITVASTAQYSTNGTPRMSKSILGSFGISPPTQSVKFVKTTNKVNGGFIATLVNQNVGQSPAKYSKRGSIGCTHGTIGNTMRFLNLSQNESSPGPDVYNPHKKMTDIRMNTREKNSPNCRFTTEKKHFTLGPITPGPSCYATQMCQPQIGDKSSVKVPFSTAGRFSGERVQTAIGNYGRHMKYRSELPSTVNITNQKSEVNKRPKSIETSHSPNKIFNYSPQPGHLRNQKAYTMCKKPPLATIGNTKRFLIDAPLSKVPATPGPSSYKIQMGLTNGTKFHMAQRYAQQNPGAPGPACYNYNPMQTLKRSPVGTIGKYKEPSFVAQKEHSPGPADYQPRVTNTDYKSRMRIEKFSKEKRFSSLTGEQVSPGPGCYFKPPKF